MTSGKMSISVDLETGYAELVLNVGPITAGEKNRKKMKNSHLRKRESETVSGAVCALLNSGGGVVKAKIEDQNYSLTRDGIGLDLENSFRNMLPVLHKHLDYMKPEGCLLIFVKAWILGISGQHLITLKTNLYTRGVSSSVEMNAPVALQFLRDRREHGGKSDSRGNFACDECQDCPATFFNKTKLTYKDAFPFTKSTHLEVKFCPKKNSLEYITESLPQSVSAFANTNGGYLFFGIDGKNQQIIGFEAEESDLAHLESEIAKCIRQLPVYHFCEEKEEIKYLCRFIEVHGPGGVCSYVCALRVERFCCAVFAKQPDSWHVEDNCVKPFTTEEWVKLQMDVTPGFSEQTSKTTLQSPSPPCIPSGWSACDNSECQPQTGHLPVSTKPTCIPETLCTELFSQHRGLEQLMQTEMGSLRQGTLIFSKSWSVDLGLQDIKGVICNVFQITEGSLPTLYFVVRVGEESEGECTVLQELGDELKDYSRRTALTLKQKLVSLGGYTEKIGIMIKILYWDHNKVLKYDSDSKIRYPGTYYLTTITVRRLLKAVYTVLSSRSL
ncbi:schlafen family member 12-like isoform X2 [Nannospalax galili]|uniref:schlafen family member 12-like isoform X2 n=1 Tax=Nannospalax galili TaxID=1026970 RepID=UPI000819DCF7|nr:schlafen family member 12-like isoform X2 [Nannospalax galili]